MMDRQKVKFNLTEEQTKYLICPHRQCTPWAGVNPYINENSSCLEQGKEKVPKNEVKLLFKDNKITKVRMNRPSKPRLKGKKEIRTVNVEKINPFGPIRRITTCCLQTIGRSLHFKRANNQIGDPERKAHRNRNSPRKENKTRHHKKINDGCSAELLTLWSRKSASKKFTNTSKKNKESRKYDDNMKCASSASKETYSIMLCEKPNVIQLGQEEPREVKIDRNSRRAKRNKETHACSKRRQGERKP